MQEWITSFMEQFGYLSVVLLIAIENIFPPIPSEVILTFGGFMTTTTAMTVFGVILWSTIGSVVGAIILYGVGRFLRPERLERWLDGRVGRWLHFKKGDIEKASAWFDKRGRSTVFFCRFIPVIRSLISIPAGISKMPIFPFLVLTTIGSAIWNTVLVYLGSVVGKSWTVIAGYMDTYSTITVIVLVLITAVVGFVFWKKRKV